MYWAMVTLTLTMGAALALQLGGWLYQVNPRLLVIVVAIALFPLGIYLSCQAQMIQIKSYWSQLWNPLKNHSSLEITPEQHPDSWKTLQSPSDKYPEPEHKDHRIQ